MVERFYFFNSKKNSNFYEESYDEITNFFGQIFNFVPKFFPYR